MCRHSTGAPWRHPLIYLQMKLLERVGAEQSRASARANDGFRIMFRIRTTWCSAYRQGHGSAILQYKTTLSQVSSPLIIAESKNWNLLGGKNCCKPDAADLGHNAAAAKTG